MFCVTLFIRLLSLVCGIAMLLFIEVKKLLTDESLANMKKSNHLECKFRCTFETIMEEDEDGEEVEETWTEHE